MNDATLQPIDLDLLRQAATEICQHAYRARADIPGSDQWAVNWADFGCTDAQRLTHAGGGQSHQVTLEEAAPDNAHLKAWFISELARRGFIDVDVATEW